MTEDELLTCMMREVEWKCRMALAGYDELAAVVATGRQSPEEVAEHARILSGFTEELKRCLKAEREVSNAAELLAAQAAHDDVTRRRGAYVAARMARQVEPVSREKQWFLAMGFVAAASMVSLLFVPIEQKKGDLKRDPRVVARLCRDLSVDPTDKASLIVSRSVRDYLQHSDERLETFYKTKGGAVLHSVIDNVEQVGVRVDAWADHFVIFDPVAMLIWIYDQSRKKESPHLKLNLHDLRDELQRVQSAAQNILQV